MRGTGQRANLSVAGGTGEIPYYCAYYVRRTGGVVADRLPIRCAARYVPRVQLVASGARVPVSAGEAGVVG